jgi:hypothetical protein
MCSIFPELARKNAPALWKFGSVSVPKLRSVVANFFQIFAELLLYFAQGFENFVGSSWKVKDPFAYCVVYGGRSDSGKTGADVFPDTVPATG